MALSPWPTDTAEIAAAVEVLRSQSGNAEDAVLTQKGKTAAELIEEYAPGAPQSIKDEAAIRCVGWLLYQQPDGVAEESIGPRSVKYQMGSKAALRNSGAMGLLTRYKVRRAGAV